MLGKQRTTAHTNLLHGAGQRLELWQQVLQLWRVEHRVRQRCEGEVHCRELVAHDEVAPVCQQLTNRCEHLRKHQARIRRLRQRVLAVAECARPDGTLSISCSDRSRCSSSSFKARPRPLRRSGYTNGISHRSTAALNLVKNDDARPSSLSVK